MTTGRMSNSDLSTSITKCIEESFKTKFKPILDNHERTVTDLTNIINTMRNENHECTVTELTNNI